MSSEGGSPETRTRILEAVLAAVLDGDEDVLNMAAVARRAGVSRQAVYLHFPDRSTLGVAAVRWLDEREDVQAALVPLRSAPDAESAVAALARFLATYNPRIAPFVRMAFRLRAIPEIEVAWMDRLRERRDSARKFAQQLADWGRLREPFTPASAGDWIIAVGSTMVWEELTKDLRWSARKYEEHLRLTVMRTLLRD